MGDGVRGDGGRVAHDPGAKADVAEELGVEDVGADSDFDLLRACVAGGAQRIARLVVFEPAQRGLDGWAGEVAVEVDLVTAGGADEEQVDGARLWREGDALAEPAGVAEGCGAGEVGVEVGGLPGGVVEAGGGVGGVVAGVDAPALVCVNEGVGGGLGVREGGKQADEDEQGLTQRVSVEKISGPVNRVERPV